ncbi:MAG: hypothetical protein ACRD4E_15415, partial [Bryobacteraceae bacterium]
MTKIKEEETIINRSDRSTYPNEKSVLTSGATPFDTDAFRLLASEASRYRHVVTTPHVLSETSNL